ncbi:MAG: hypothetical protein ACTSRA_00680 [Promethearchaeota archaeon]|nr:MAG: hypothetical protein [Helarchaeota virus Nidhogg Meg22_1012]URC17473.1 MAG: hypothetical protein [Helarchaeota virus Nidhogg Meg22_1214]
MLNLVYDDKLIKIYIAYNEFCFKPYFCELCDFKTTRFVYDDGKKIKLCRHCLELQLASNDDAMRWMNIQYGDIVGAKFMGFHLHNCGTIEFYYHEKLTSQMCTVKSKCNFRAKIIEYKTLFGYKNGLIVNYICPKCFNRFYRSRLYE